NIVAMTWSHSARALRSSAACPSWSAPMVMTTPTRPVIPARSFASSARVCTTSVMPPPLLERGRRWSCRYLYGGGERLEQRLGVHRAEPAGRDRRVRGAAGQREVGRDGVGRATAQLGQVTGDRAGVPSGNRTGQRGVAVSERVLQGGP